MISVVISSDVFQQTISGIAIAGLIVMLMASQFINRGSSRLGQLPRYLSIYVIPLAVLLALFAIARAITAIFG